jgi:hypothetical protein
MMRSRQRSRARRWLAACTTLVLIAVAGLIPAAAVRAADEPTNMVLVWNENAINVISAAPTANPPGLGNAPPLSPLHLAMVHGAIYDAVNAIDGGHEPYLEGLSAIAGASEAAAVAQAAHDVLIGLTPDTLTAVKTRIDDMLTASLLLIDDGPAQDHGTAIGADAAAAMLAARIGDGRFDSEPFPVGEDPGEWRLVPPLSNNVFGQFATVTPLTMNSPDQFRTEGPLDMTSAQYAAEFNEVKALGAKENSSRSAAQTSLASFVSANPIPYMNKGLREIAVAHALSTSEQALLFVKTSMASADALIACFNDKANYLVWRPQTAIQNATADGNPATLQQDNWVSLYPTPGYPDHPSGYNCYSAGVWHSARLFFGTDKVGFSLTSPGTAPIAGSTRNYTRFTGVIDDTIDGRIYTGFHFRTPDVQGAWIGKKAAQWVDKHYFEPVN